MPTLPAELNERFSVYQRLLLKWNSKLNLTGIRSEEEILRRHFVECIFCATHLPVKISTLLDYGSGAGFPGIPIALCRPEISVTLAESQSKKSNFLREACRELKLEVEIHPGRAENLRTHYDAVVMRAVERMDKAVPAAVERLTRGGSIVLMVSRSSRFAERFPELIWDGALDLPYSQQNILLIAKSPG